jgi:uncharacterized protein YjbI with pentapeptide repeats
LDTDLADAKFSNADLRGADLKGASLRYADLQGADLREADLTGSFLVGTVIDNCTEWQKITSMKGAIISGWVNMPIDFVVFAFLNGAEFLEYEEYRWIMEKEFER